MKMPDSSCHNFVLLFITQLVHVGAIPPLQNCIAYSSNTDIMEFFGWKKDSIPAEYYLFLLYLFLEQLRWRLFFIPLTDPM